MESDIRQYYQRKPIRWVTAILTVFFLGLAVDYFFIHFFFNEKIRELQKQEQTLPAPTPTL